MTEQYVVIRHSDGREGAVLPSNLANPDYAENFKGAHILRNEDGTDWDGPTTPDGMVRKAEREAEERSEERAKARAERAALSASAAKDDDAKPAASDATRKE